MTNLLGTVPAPSSIPDTQPPPGVTWLGDLPPASYVYGSNLLGFSQTVLADCDAVIGQFHLANIGTLVGGVRAPNVQWFLSTRYQAVTPLCDDEWAEIAAQCTPALTGSPLVVV